MADATTYKTEEAEILQRLEDQWAEATDIAWPNQQYEPGSAAWIEPVVNRQQPFNADIATSRRVRHPGLLTINVRTPLNQGEKAALEYADDLVDIYRNVTFSGLTFRVPQVDTIGRDGKWWRVQVDCPYHRDSIH